MVSVSNKTHIDFQQTMLKPVSVNELLLTEIIRDNDLSDSRRESPWHGPTVKISSKSD